MHAPHHQKISRKRPLIAMFLAFAAIAPAMRELRIRAMSDFVEGQRYEQTFYLPRPEWLRLLSGGYREALAGLIWMRALVYLGEEMFQKGEHAHTFRYSDAILELDPEFRAVYVWTATVVAYNTRGPTKEEMLKALTYLERGVSRFPGDGKLAWELGSFLSFELPSWIDEREEREELRARGAEHLMTAARLGAAPPWMALSNATQLEKLGRLEQAARHLEEMYSVVQDPDTREQIADRLARMRSEAFAEGLRQTFGTLEAERSREYPYIPVDLFLFLGSRLQFDEKQYFRSGFAPPSPAILAE